MVLAITEFEPTISPVLNWASQIYRALYRVAETQIRKAPVGAFLMLFVYMAYYALAKTILT
ncbi:hypothetical protein GCM10026988_14630 [Vibrio panuliri]